ncbi:tryptophan ABC transporter substrate-binding protein [Lentilactobacillus sp. SPB1-3]|uniref:Tryptophan ABC transporter substrate-binding protein n=1 Tax=Lentilactobacillus terminaliae TaxID=3003483 RepID=A0ACD5DFR4_9LACO|nr:tryptophan ABC transporter substrate-binding protein [Lentilactobacillus sp. SPB1-3]MCZ0976629.1 tryptophan ABC transporter substrate-binding protein [Lentilactobacillus sp. SPB1-3]
MTKRSYPLITAIIILFAFLGYAFFAEKSDQNSAEPKTPTVGILQLMSHPALDAIHQGIIAGLKEEGYIPGKNINIDFQNAQNDQSNLKTMSSKFANENADLSIGIATPAAQALANSISDRPIILGDITDPNGAGLVKSNDRPGGNITGVSDKAPFKLQLGLIKRLMPNMKTLGIIYTSSDDSAVAQYKMFKALCKQEHVKLKAYSITNTNDLNQVAQQAVNSVDAIYVPTDNTIAGAISTLVGAANQAGVPIFPGVDTMVKAGGVATYAIDQFQLGVATGKMSAEILEGKKKPATTPIKYFTKSKLIINERAAKKLNIHIPASLMKEAQTKGEIVK